MNADAKSLPLRADYLKGLDADIRKHPRIRASLETIANLGRSNTSEEIIELLRKFQGPVQ